MQVNEALKRFERVVGDEVVFANYRHADGRMLITHVEAPRPLRGTEEAARLMQEIADHARASGQAVTPLCGYAVAWFRRHPDYADLLA
jgi:predicted GNAT family acetyltransferase